MAKLVDVKGMVQVKRGGKWKTATNSFVLQEGDRISVGPKSSARISKPGNNNDIKIGQLEALTWTEKKQPQKPTGKPLPESAQKSKEPKPLTTANLDAMAKAPPWTGAPGE